MSSPIRDTEFNLTPTALFPAKPEAASDEKCVIISKVIQDLATSCNMTGVTQEVLNNDANDRYVYLSREEKLSLPSADHAAFSLYKRGVSIENAKEYYSIRLTADDASHWIIIPC